MRKPPHGSNRETGHPGAERNTSISIRLNLSAPSTLIIHPQLALSNTLQVHLVLESTLPCKLIFRWISGQECGLKSNSSPDIISSNYINKFLARRRRSQQWMYSILPFHP
jgi:hypothetical protein